MEEKSVFTLADWLKEIKEKNFSDGVIQELMAILNILIFDLNEKRKLVFFIYDNPIFNRSSHPSLRR
jgi:hypothetical protein